jgi:hypothetical protein
VIHPAQGLETFTDDLVRPPAGDICDKTHATGVVLVRRVVEPFGGALRVRMNHRASLSSLALRGIGRDDVGPAESFESTLGVPELHQRRLITRGRTV